MRGRPRAGLPGATVTTLTPAAGAASDGIEQELPARQRRTGDARRVGGRVEPAAQRVRDRLRPPRRGRGRATASASRNLIAARTRGRAGRRGSTTKACSPVRYAMPVTCGTHARGVRRPSTVPSTVPDEACCPTIESCRSTAPAGSRPSAASTASRAQVPEPHGERSTSPSAKTVTLRWWTWPSSVAEVVEPDRAVDAAQPRVASGARRARCRSAPT